MHAITITDILTALRHTDPDALAAAIYADADPRLLDALAATLAGAAGRTAAHPHLEVIAEADALLFEVLRWPVADALPDGHNLPTAGELAAARQITVPDAERLLHRITATEGDAATRLIDSGVEPNFTLEQVQVTACITDVLADGRTPTRAAVRAHALDVASRAMRPGDGTEPVIAGDVRLPARILSPSPMAVVPGWLDRMDADPPLTGLLDDRITRLLAVKTAIGAAARQHTTALIAVEHARVVGSTAPPPGPATPAQFLHRMAV